MRGLVTGVLVASAFVAVPLAQDAKVKHGQQVYAEQKCGLCHSIGDKGNKKGPLDGVGTKLKEAEIREWMTDAKGMTAKTKASRKPDMKSYALPKDDLDAVVAYMMSLKKG
jgi:mono/diheme cytochrome c family protein